MANDADAIDLMNENTRLRAENDRLLPAQAALEQCSIIASSYAALGIAGHREILDAIRKIARRRKP